MEKLDGKDIELVVAGDVQRLPLLAQHTHEELRQAWQRSKRPRVTRQGLLRVLMGVRRGEVTQEQAADWAGFIFSGYTSSAKLPLQRLGIEYDPADEDLVARVVMRLEQIGDDVDGPMSVVELEELLAELSLRPDASNR